MRFAALLLGGVTCCLPVAARAQTVTFEGGAAGGLAITSSAGAGLEGGYVAANVNAPAATWLSVYGGVHGIGGSGSLGQAGAAFRLGPEHSFVRPTLRGGGLFVEDWGMATGGLGVYVGRRAGGVFTADLGYRRGALFAFVHMGVYYSFD